jgi:hypothetical protein
VPFPEKGKALAQLDPFQVHQNGAPCKDVTLLVETIGKKLQNFLKEL